MEKKKLVLGIILGFLGLIGVASILTMELPLPPDAEAILKAKFSPEQIKLLLLVNPIVLLLIAVTIGVVFYQKVNLRVPIIEKAVGIHTETVSYSDILKFGIVGGAIAGVLICLDGIVFNPVLPAEFKALGESIKPSLAARFLYGGLTEEIMMRFGFMTFLVWLSSKVFKNLDSKVYWTGIVLAAILFGLGHFPVAYQAVPNPSASLLLYILIGNTVGGIVFGWLYWKKGLEAAFIAHLFAHVIMVLAEPYIG